MRSTSGAGGSGSSLISTLPDPLMNYTQNYLRTEFYNPGGANDGADGLLQQVYAPCDDSAKEPVFGQMSQTVFDNIASAPIIQKPDVVAYSKRVSTVLLTRRRGLSKHTRDLRTATRQVCRERLTDVPQDAHHPS